MAKDVKQKDDEELKKIIIEKIKKIGFPIAFLRGEADGSYGFYAKSENDIIGLDYAEDNYKEVNGVISIVKVSLQDLSLIDLTQLLKGTTPKDGYWSDIEEEVKNSESQIKKDKLSLEKFGKLYYLLNDTQRKHMGGKI
jgi:hypothetical protein